MRSSAAAIRKKFRERDYNSRVHRTLKANLAPWVASGRAVCGECGGPIGAGERWDLAHDREDRGRYLGPAHVRCNRRTNVKASVSGTSREW